MIPHPEPADAVQPPRQVDAVLDHAVFYIRQYGWGLCKIAPRSKRPVHNQWNRLPSLFIDTEEKAVAELTPGTPWNIGLIHAPSGTGAFDIDDYAWTRHVFAEFGFDLDDILKGYPSINGREGRRKILFRLPDGCALSAKKLNWIKQNPANAKDFFTLFELRAGDVQDVLPPSIHPDTGNPYTWGVAPWDLPEIPVIPGVLLTLWEEFDESFRRQLESVCPWRAAGDNAPPPRMARRDVSPGQTGVIEAFNAAHSCIALLESRGYVRCGKRYLAPSSSSKIPGVVLFENDRFFSHHASDVFNDGYAHDAFDVYCQFEFGGNTQRAVKQAALVLGIEREHDSGPLPEIDLSDEDSHPPPQAVLAKTAFTSEEFQPPGIAFDIYDWGLRTAVKKQPELTINATWAILSALLGRRVRTNYRNWTSMYFQNMALSGEGKEHARTMAALLLDAIGQGQRFGHGGFTSSGGLFSALLANPAQLVVIDELGRTLKSSQAKGNHNKAESITEIMSVFGQCDSILKPPSYSTMTATKEKKSAMADLKIYNPALSLLNLTTPQTFFDTITHDWIADGYLGRFIIVNSLRERQLSGKPESLEVPESIKAWWEVIAARLNEAELSATSLEKSDEPPPSVIALTLADEAEQVFERMEREINARMNALEKEGIQDMLVRTREKAMRLAAVVALAINPNTARIGRDAALYAADYVRACDYSLVEMVRARVANTEFGRLRLKLIAELQSAGPEGMTRRDMGRFSSAFKGLRPREQDELLESLVASGEITVKTLKPKRGPSREVWVAA